MVFILPIPPVDGMGRYFIRSAGRRGKSREPIPRKKIQPSDSTMHPKLPFVLCATDFSRSADGAALVAAKLARRRGEPLRLVHVTRETQIRDRAILRGRLEAELGRLPPGAGEPRLLLGAHPADELLAYIRSEKPSLVVVGGAVDKPRRWALGSFSEKVAEASPVPTLVVRDPALFDGWDWTKARCSVLLALDFFSSSDAVLRWAKGFQMAGPCDFVACHVNWQVPTMDRPAIANPPEFQARLERNLRKKVRDGLGDNSVPVVVRPFFGEPGGGVVQIAVEQKSQLIAVATHQRHGLRRLAQFSVSRDVLRQADTNVLCVPVTAPFDPREAHVPDYHRVLVATDFSELGNSAIPFACGLCGIGGLVRIVHVRPPRARVAPEVATALLRGLIPSETGARCQTPEVAVLSGSNPAAAICAEAENFGADAVCLASHGRGASRALHGSVARAVMTRLQLPLLIVRRPEA